MGIDAIFVGGEAWDREKFAVMPQFEGAYMMATWSPDVQGERSRAFVEEYVSRFDSRPEDGAALTCDALQILFRAIKNVEKLDAESIRDELYDLGPYHGVTGAIDFIHSGGPEKAGVILRFENGRTMIIRPILLTQEN